MPFMPVLEWTTTNGFPTTTGTVPGISNPISPLTPAPGQQLIVVPSCPTLTLYPAYPDVLGIAATVSVKFPFVPHLYIVPHGSGNGVATAPCDMSRWGSGIRTVKYQNAHRRPGPAQT